MGRILGVDYGARRIGIAVANPRGTIASPAEAIPGSGSAPGDAERVLAWAARNDVACIVVGLPLNMDGSDSAQTRHTRAFADALRAHGDLPVELWDERLSTFQAEQFLEAADVRRSRRKKLRDALAAQVILQSYLDARGRSGG